MCMKKMWGGIEIDDDLVKLFLEKLTTIKAGEANEFLEHLAFNLEDFVGSEMDTNKVEELEAAVDSLETKVDRLAKEKRGLHKEVNKLLDEVDGYVDENREYVRVLKALGRGDMVNTRDRR